ncbi:GspH/FimT family pseudopilin [Hyphomonas sp. NPDC076900]|uniref:GspH/FimT family pseudopilin n=1 Tax=unclassified Hyphomonas TaxID=2630699 RepID=UPI003D05D4F8
MKRDVPSSATHPLRALPGDPQAGLSLVEIMVTLSIIAVATTLILLTIPTRHVFKQESDQLREALEQAANRALITGQPVGLIVEDASYSPAIWQNGAWRLLESHQLPKDISIRIDGKPPEVLEKGEEPAPAVIFDPLGHTLPVAIELSRNGVLTRLTLLPDGNVEMDLR